VRIDRLCRERHLNIRWTAFPLHPETPDAGRRLDELFAGNPGYIEAMWSRLQAAGHELGLTFAQRTHTYNSHRACLLAYWAREQGREWEFHLATYRAYFERGENLAQGDVLERICLAAGLGGSQVMAALDNPVYQEALAADWRRCRERGVHAIPTLERGGRQLVGYQPGQMEKLLENS